MSTPSDPFAEHDAAYVMGALSAGERREYEAHLAICDRCRASVAELSGMPGLLALVAAEHVVDAPVDAGPVPETILAGLVLRVRDDRRRRALTGVGIAAAVILIALLAVALPGRLGGPSGRDGRHVAALTPVHPLPVTASVLVERKAWGTRIRMTCAYALNEPLAPGSPRATYRLVVVPTGNRPPQQLANWRTLPATAVTVEGTTALPVEELASIQLQAGDGTVLLQGPPPR